MVGAAPLEEPAMMRLRGGGRPRKRPRSPVEERANSNAQASTSAVSTSQPLFKPGDHVEVQPVHHPVSRHKLKPT